MIGGKPVSGASKWAEWIHSQPTSLEDPEVLGPPPNGETDRGAQESPLPCPWERSPAANVEGLQICEWAPASDPGAWMLQDGTNLLRCQGCLRVRLQCFGLGIPWEILPAVVLYQDARAIQADHRCIFFCVDLELTGSLDELLEALKEQNLPQWTGDVAILSVEIPVPRSFQHHWYDTSPASIQAKLIEGILLPQWEPNDHLHRFFVANSARCGGQWS